MVSDVVWTFLGSVGFGRFGRVLAQEAAILVLYWQTFVFLSSRNLHLFVEYYSPSEIIVVN